jgi:hypothetical protein
MTTIYDNFCYSKKLKELDLLNLLKEDFKKICEEVVKFDYFGLTGAGLQIE